MQPEISLPTSAESRIIDFIKLKVKESGAKGVVLGLSGGLDSAVLTKLCTLALGKAKVLALLLFDKTAKKQDFKDAARFAKSLGIKFKIINIDKIVREFILKCGLKDIKTVGNLKARVRMVIMYYYANSLNCLVAGAGNKSELLIGYFTKYGDGGVDLLPLGDLYKTQILELARKLNIPKKIINKVPSAGLWKGQTDEKELGIKYAALDKILYALELGLKKEVIAKKLKLKLAQIEQVCKRVESSKHKRAVPPIAKVSE